MDKHSQMKQKFDQAKARNAERSKIFSKKKLIDAISKKMRTTMVGAVAACEDYMGHLWGHGKDNSQLSVAEREWRLTWEELRAAILDKGNNQLRNAIEEINRYSFEYQKYHTDLVISKDYHDRLMTPEDKEMRRQAVESYQQRDNKEQ